MMLRRTIAVEISDTVVRAVEMRSVRGALEVIRAVCVPVPADVNADDVQALGAWAGSALRAAGISTSNDVIAVIDRESCSIRTMELPTDDDSELPDMARLAAIRETPSEVGSLVVDVIGRGMQQASSVALVVTASERAVTRVRELSIAAGFRPVQITPRTFGLVTLARFAEADEGFTVAVDAPGDGLELLVIGNGEIVHSRGVRLDIDSETSVVAGEARRSLSAWQLASPDARIGAAYFFGSEETHHALADILERSMGVPLRAFAPNDQIVVATNVDRTALSTVWPLVGLLRECAAGEEIINLAAPRKAPDLAARRRMQMLAAAGILCVAGFLGWTIGNKSWQSLEAETEATDEEARALMPLHLRQKRDLARLSHITTWQQAAPEWLEHLKFLHGFAADPAKIVLDRWAGTLDASDVKFGRDEKWSIERSVKIVLQGEAKERTIADDLRDALVDDARYSLTSTGADTEGGRRFRSPFSYVLRSDEVRSPTVRASKRPDAATSGGDSSATGGGT